MIISESQLIVFLLILARIIGLFSSAPVFNARTFPSSGKIAIAIWVSLLLWFVIPINPIFLPKSPVFFIISLVSEVTIGFLIGFIANIIFLAVQAAGEIIDLQMGLSVAQQFDPIFGASVSIIGRLYFYIVLTTFLAVNGHHLLLTVINHSFNLLPLGSMPNLASPKFISQLLGLGKIYWGIAFQLCGPIILIIFLSDYAFGIVSRVAPQVNVFQLGFQVKPALGLIGLLFTLPILVDHLTRLLQTMGEEMVKLMAGVR